MWRCCLTNQMLVLHWALITEIHQLDQILLLTFHGSCILPCLPSTAFTKMPPLLSSLSPSLVHLLWPGAVFGAPGTRNSTERLAGRTINERPLRTSLTDFHSNLPRSTRSFFLGFGSTLSPGVAPRGGSGPKYVTEHVPSTGLPLGHTWSSVTAHCLFGDTCWCLDPLPQLPVSSFCVSLPDFHTTVSEFRVFVLTFKSPLVYSVFNMWSLVSSTYCVPGSALDSEGTVLSRRHGSASQNCLAGKTDKKENHSEHKQGLNGKMCYEIDTKGPRRNLLEVGEP